MERILHIEMCILLYARISPFEPLFTAVVVCSLIEEERDSIVMDVICLHYIYF